MEVPYLQYVNRNMNRNPFDRYEKCILPLTVISGSIVIVSHFFFLQNLLSSIFWSRLFTGSLNFWSPLNPASAIPEGPLCGIYFFSFSNFHFKRSGNLMVNFRKKFYHIYYFVKQLFPLSPNTYHWLTIVYNNRENKQLSLYS